MPEARKTGAFVDPVFDHHFDAIRLTQFDERVWQSTLQRIGTDSIRAHPGQVPAVVARNALAFFELKPSFNRNAERFDGRNLSVRTWALPIFYLVTIAGLAGLVLRRRSPPVILLAGVCLYFALVSLFFVAPPRLRAPFDLLCGLGTGLLLDWWIGRRTSSAVVVDPAPEAGSAEP